MGGWLAYFCDSRIGSSALFAEFKIEIIPAKGRKSATKKFSEWSYRKRWSDFGGEDR
jgi:hypothetical protein